MNDQLKAQGKGFKLENGIESNNYKSKYLPGQYPECPECGCTHMHHFDGIINDEIGLHLKFTCGDCKLVFSELSAEGFGVDYPHLAKPQLTIPWPAILFITGLAIGFIFGVLK